MTALNLASWLQCGTSLPRVPSVSCRLFVVSVFYWWHWYNGDVDECGSANHVVDNGEHHTIKWCVYTPTYSVYCKEAPLRLKISNFVADYYPGLSIKFRINQKSTLLLSQQVCCIFYICTVVLLLCWCDCNIIQWFLVHFEILPFKS